VEADKITRMQKELDDVKEILQKSIEQVRATFKCMMPRYFLTLRK